MTGWLSTHVLDTAQGCPAGGMILELWKLEPAEDGMVSSDSASSALAGLGLRYYLLKTAQTNEDGRTDSPLLEGTDVQKGHYEITFAVGEYFAKTNLELPEEHPFLTIVPVRFSIANPLAHYHVPLLVSPWSYSTYRGS